VIDALAAIAIGLADALQGRLGAPIQRGKTIPTAPAEPLASPSSDGDPDYHRLWNALGHDPTGMDELISRSGLTVARASAMLLSMELDGRVAAAHGRYSRKS